MLLKNTDGQGVFLYAHDLLNDAPKTGDASNITAKLSKDGGTLTDTATANPTEIGRGVYWLPLSQAETNAEALAIAAVSSTTNVTLAPVFAQTGIIPTTGDVTLAAAQPHYAPAKAGDAMTLTAAYDAAKTAAQPGNAMTLTAAYDAAKAAAQESTANAIGVIVSGIAAVLSGITSLAAWLRGLYRKDAMDATAKAEVNQGGGAYDEANDSVEAIRDRGDAAWAGGGGGSCVWLPAEKDAVVDKMAAIGSGTVVIRSPITPDGKRITVTPGDDMVASLGRSIDLALAYPTWADLSSASVVLKVYDRLAGRWTVPWLEVAGVILDGGTADQAARFEMAAAITTRFERLGIDAYSWRAFAYLVGGQTITIGAGDVDVLPASEA